MSSIVIVRFKNSRLLYMESRQSYLVRLDQEEMWRYGTNAIFSCRSYKVLQIENESMPRMWHLVARSGLSEWPRQYITVYLNAQYP